MENNLNDQFFKEVSMLYKETHSLQKTAAQMGVAYGKIRKILITLGEYEKPVIIEIGNLKKHGLSISEISKVVGMSEKSVNAFLPYEKGIYTAPEQTLDARKSELYRKRIVTAKKKTVIRQYQIKKKKIELKEREENMSEKNNGAMNLYPVRLHLELRNEWCNDEELKILMKYADATERGTLTRDILIPSDMPLHNLHYAIQRLYGWQNSHLRCFHLEEKDYNRLTGGMVKGWMPLVGTLLKGLTEDEGDAFWDDDYENGSIKTWLMKKYTGPYSYGGYEENYQVAQKSVKQFVESFPVLDVKEGFGDYYKRTKDQIAGEKEPERVLKTAPIMELSLKELNDTIIIEEGMVNLLERLKVADVLASQSGRIADAGELGTRLVNANVILNKKMKCQMQEPEVLPVTHKLQYNYDFGDNWVVEITRYDDGYDLLENGKVSAEELSSAEQLVIEKHKPVCIYKKGAQVLDDVGGMSGFTDFISTIYGDDTAEKEESRTWAESLGWSSRKRSADKLL